MTFLFWHSALNHCHIATVDNGAVPVGNHHLLHFGAFGIHHQSGGARVEAVHHMCVATLARFDKIAVEQVFHVEAVAPNTHRKHLVGLVNHYHIGIFIHHAEILTEIEACASGARVLADFHQRVGVYNKVVSGLRHLVNQYASTSKDSFRLAATDAVEFFHHKLKQRHFFSREKLGVFCINVWHIASRSGAVVVFTHNILL